MANLFFAKDYTAYVDYIYPGIIAMAGSKEKLIAATQESIGKMESNGLAFSRISFGTPSKTVVAGSELQATIPQVVEIKFEGKVIVTEYALIAISGDNGQNWTFIDTAGNDLKALQGSLPNLSSELVVPERKQRTIE